MHLKSYLCGSVLSMGTQRQPDPSAVEVCDEIGGAKRMEPSSNLWCPAIGQAAMGRN